MPGATAAASTFRAVDVIRSKRDGERLSDEVIATLIDEYVADRVPDYQMSALLMAMLLKGMDDGEALALTRSMVSSGDTVDLSPIGRRIVDKHSTGGVGDKVSLALGPIVAACGVPFAKMSGRGLGHTGGTLDKLESIHGFTVELDQTRFFRQVREVGVAIVGQTADIVPADKRLYALRDVTATVESIPLIAASVMSKKLAAGADAILLDVKVGSGAFMKTLDDARTLADTMVRIGTGAGRQVQVLITSMEQPLGYAVGNALEIAEVIALLEGRAPAGLTELVMSAAGCLLAMSDLGIDEDEGRRRADAVVASGEARERFDRWIAAQGGDLSRGLPQAVVQHTVLAARGGTIESLDALVVGEAACRLGAGRLTKDAKIDHAVGIQLHANVGDPIQPGDPLVTVHARTEEDACWAAQQVEQATVVGTALPAHTSLILDRR